MERLVPVKRFRQVALKFFPCSLLCLLLLNCDSDPGSGPLSPIGPDYPPIQPDQPASAELQMDINLTLRQGQAASSALLAATRDDSTSDSLGLYIDVEVANVRPELIFLHAEADTLSIIAKVSFVVYPYNRYFSRGRIRLAIGQTNTGLMAAEVFETDFETDTTIVASLPLSRIDSFRVADNVAVYGRVLSEGRFFEAYLVSRFETPEPPATGAPVLVGYVKSMDLIRNRLYVSDAIVALNDTTRIETSDGEPLSLELLKTGDNELTITAMAWALEGDGAILANGWEFDHFNLVVVRPLNQ